MAGHENDQKAIGEAAELALDDLDDIPLDDLPDLTDLVTDDEGDPPTPHPTT